MCVCVCVCGHREAPVVEYYEFDTGLLMEPCAPKADASQLVVNNLTHANLTHKWVQGNQSSDHATGAAVLLYWVIINIFQHSIWDLCHC